MKARDAERESRHRRDAAYNEAHSVIQVSGREAAAPAHSGHRDHSDRSIVITEIGGS